MLPPPGASQAYPRGPWCCCLWAILGCRHDVEIFFDGCLPSVGSPPTAPQSASPPATPALECSAPHGPPRFASWPFCPPPPRHRCPHRPLCLWSEAQAWFVGAEAVRRAGCARVKATLPNKTAHPPPVLFGNPSLTRARSSRVGA